MTTSVSIDVLERTPGRALSFLRGVSTSWDIRTAMARAGYTEADHQEGWALLLAVSGYASAAPPPSSDDAKVRAAIAEIDGWDESGFRRIHAALRRFHPEVDAALFAGISSEVGAASVVSVSTLLDRLDALEKGKKDEKAALKTLEKRGIDSATRKHLRELCEIAKSVAVPVAPAPPAEPSDEQVKKLGELYAWFQDWSDTARSVVRRRDHLQLLGLAQRIRRSKQDDESDATDAFGDEPTSAPSNGATQPVIGA